MKRFLSCLVGALLIVVGLVGTAAAQPGPEFRLGFKALADQIPGIVGEPLEPEHYGPNGDSLQLTTRGLMAWRKADNWTAFTDGATTWINGPVGLQSRHNLARFPWESGAQLIAAPASTPVPVAVPLPTPAPTPLPFADWQPGPQAAGSSIMGVIDSPKVGDRVSVDLAIIGWALDPKSEGQAWNGIDDFRVFLDGPESVGTRLDRGNQQSVRYDVAARLGRPSYANSGFSVSINPDLVPSGQHTLYLYIHSKASGWWMKTVAVVFERPVIGTVTINGKQYLTNLALAAQTNDPYLRGALAYAYNYAPDWRRLADAAALRGTKLRWGAVPKGVAGQYSPDDRTITINSNYYSEYTGVVAGILGHEVYHAAFDARTGARGCFQDEINAFTWGAYVWSQVPRGRSMTSLEINEDWVVYYWQRDALADYVVTTPGYQQQCLGGVLVSP